MPRMPALAAFLLAALLASTASAFDNEEIDVYDLVEEVNANFYEYMELTQEATTADIRKAYRRLSLVLHPDKNKEEDAEVKFRWLASIYDVLKDPKKREVYDRVLVDGLPDWRMPVYYYRRMRKMGLAEGVAYLLAIVTVIQYCVNWAAYWEKKFTLGEAVNTQMKRYQKKKRQHLQEEVSQAMEREKEKILGPKPTAYDTLPFQTYRAVKYVLFAIPTLPSVLYAAYVEAKEKKLAEKKRIEEEEEERKRREQEKKEKKERAKRNRVDRYEDRTGMADDDDEDDDDGAPPAPSAGDAFKQPANALQMWTDQDLAKLARLMKKYPPGTNERWEKIADVMERLPWEVTKMAKKVKDVAYQVPISKSAQGVTGLEDNKLISDDVMENEEEAEEEDDEEEETDSDDETDYDEVGDGLAYTVATKEDYVPVEIKERKKTKGGKLGREAAEVEKEEATASASPASSEDWSQQQQKALESALQQFPKGTAERWARIANKVPGKSERDCMLRYKTIAEGIRKKKEAGGGGGDPKAE